MKCYLVGKFSSVPGASDDVVVKLMVVDGSPFDVIIGNPAMGDLQGVFDFGKRTVRLTRGEHTVELPFERDYSREKESGKGTDREEFTYDYSAVP